MKNSNQKTWEDMRAEVLREYLPVPNAEERAALDKALEERAVQYAIAQKIYSGYELVEVTSLGDLKAIFVPGERL